MSRRRMTLATSLAAIFWVSLASAQDNWPQWRGPDQNGVSDSKGLPLKWSVDENVVWKTELPSWSGGTPIIWGDRIFITSPSAPDAQEVKSHEDQLEKEQNPRRRRRIGRFPGGQDLLIMCLSKTDGKILWQHKLDEGNKLWLKGNNTSPSPVTDGSHLWVVTGTGAVTCLDMDGHSIWQVMLQDKYGPFGQNWGYASSPLLHDGKLILEVLHGMHTDDASYVVAFDAKTGEELWHQERPTDAPREAPDAYTTPLLIEHNGETQIVISGADYVTGHDPDTGTELWRVAGLNPRNAGNYRIVASPLFVDGMLYAPTRVRPLLAINVGGENITEANIVWKWDASGSPDVPTPACDGTNFFMINDAGMITCLDAKSGEVIWGPKRTIRGTVSSSPILADDRIYFTNEEAVTIVVSAGPEFEILATNELDGSYTLSSPVPSGGQLFIRTGTHLYCIDD